MLPGDAAEGEQAEGAVVADARRQQDERIDAPAVDRQFLNLARVHHLGDVGLGVFHQGRRGGDVHLRGRLAHRQAHVQIEILAHLQNDVFGVVIRRNPRP